MVSETLTVIRNFSSIHAAHIVPMNKMVVPYVLTGYETIIPIKSGGKFVVIAEDNGVVESVTKDNVTVNYGSIGYIVKGNLEYDVNKVTDLFYDTLKSSLEKKGYGVQFIESNLPLSSIPKGNKDDVYITFSRGERYTKELKASGVKSKFIGIGVHDDTEHDVVLRNPKDKTLENNLSADSIREHYTITPSMLKELDSNIPSSSGRKVKVRLYKWTTKEEAGSCYTHELVANLQPGIRFLKDDTIAYDKLFFEPCIFDPRRVIYKQGALVNTMLSEDIQTYEDSVAISGSLHNVLGTTLTTVKSIVREHSDTLLNVMDVGEKVEANTLILTTVSGDVPIGNNLDDKALETLKDFGAEAVKSDVKGTISKIVVYYNFDIKEASPSIRKLIDYSDKILMKTRGYTGRILTGYSIQGVPLQEGYCEIKVYIDVNEAMGTGDKCILGNQMKCTVGEVYDYEMTTETGDKIEAVFANTSISARKVNSPNLIGTTSTLLRKIEKEAVKLYF